jgi:hypothetical protein
VLGQLRSRRFAPSAQKELLVRKYALAWLLCSLLAACGDDGDGGEDGDVTGSKSGQLALYCEAQCERSLECGPFADLGVTQESCEKTCLKMNASLPKQRPCLFTDECIEGHRTLDCESSNELVPPEACTKSCE